MRNKTQLPRSISVSYALLTRWNIQIVLVASLFVLGIIYLWSPSLILHDITSKLPAAVGTNILKVSRTVDDKVPIELNLSRNQDNVVVLGPHSVIITMPCASARFWMRWTGDGLVAVTLTEHDAKKRTWIGSFVLPMEGSYDLDVRWYGCDASATGGANDFKSLDEPLNIRVVASIDDESPAMIVPASSGSIGSKERLFQSNSAWIHRSLLKPATDLELPNYSWMKVHGHISEGEILSTASSMVLSEGTLQHPDDYYKFSDLSNYELVW